VVPTPPPLLSCAYILYIVLVLQFTSELELWMNANAQCFCR